MASHLDHIQAKLESKVTVSLAYTHTHDLQYTQDHCCVYNHLVHAQELLTVHHISVLSQREKSHLAEVKLMIGGQFWDNFDKSENALSSRYIVFVPRRNAIK